jgi:hypothetical protein
MIVTHVICFPQLIELVSNKNGQFCFRIHQNSLTLYMSNIKIGWKTVLLIFADTNNRSAFFRFDDLDPCFAFSRVFWKRFSPFFRWKTVIRAQNQQNKLQLHFE